MFQHLDVVALRCAIRDAFRDNPQLFPMLSEYPKPGTKLNTATRDFLDKLVQASPDSAAAVLASRNKFLSAHGRTLEGFDGKLGDSPRPRRADPIPPMPPPPCPFKIGDRVTATSNVGTEITGIITAEDSTVPWPHPQRSRFKVEDETTHHRLWVYDLTIKAAPQADSWNGFKIGDRVYGTKLASPLDPITGTLFIFDEQGAEGAHFRLKTDDDEVWWVEDSSLRHADAGDKPANLCPGDYVSACGTQGVITSMDNADIRIWDAKDPAHPRFTARPSQVTKLFGRGDTITGAISSFDTNSGTIVTGKIDSADFSDPKDCYRVLSNLGARWLQTDTIQLKEESPVAKAPTPPVSPDAAAALQALLAALGPKQDSAELQAIREKLTALEARIEDRPQRLEIQINDRPKIDLPALRHREMPKLIHWLSLKKHIYLPGPSGSGKSHAAEQAATALGLPFYAKSFSPQATEAALLGYMDAHGKLVRTLYREAYEHGGVFLLDEIDASSSAIPVVLNASLSNGFCAFPDGMVEMHPNFRAICGANTWGNGKTLEYVGRNPLDGAFLNRFVKLYWDYDERLELGIAPWDPWTHYVQAVRKALRDAGIKAIITPRDSISGGDYILSGGTIEDAREALIYPGLSDQAKQVVAKIALPMPPELKKEA